MRTMVIAHWLPVPGKPGWYYCSKCGGMIPHKGKMPVEVINCGSFMDYGGYAVDAAHRVAAQKMYMLRLLDQGRGMETKGFYL